MRLETNKFNFTKQLINEKMNHVLKEWNTSFKNNRGENIKQEFCSPEQKAEMAILLELIAGKSSALYSSLLEQGLINESFSADFDCGRGYAVSAFTGESVDPDKTAQEIKNEIDRLRKNGIDKERFEAVKRKKGYTK